MVSRAPGNQTYRGTGPGGGQRVGQDEAMSAPAGLLQAQQEFARDTVWLNTATLGLPPHRVVRAVQETLTDWQVGRADPDRFDEAVERARAGYADLVGVGVDAVAIGSQASVLVGMVASSLPAGSEVLTARGEFTSVTFPFHARAAATGDVEVREVDLDALAEQVRPSTTWVAVSAVQSADGSMVDTEALREACRRTGTRVLLDTTQAAGWLPVQAAEWDVTVCSGYKWLLNPRGTAYLTVTPDLGDALVPTGAGWYAGQDRWSSIYGAPLRLASNARRFDTSPAWFSWVGAAPALEMLNAVGAPALHEHAAGLADRFRVGTGLPPGPSAIVSCEVDAAGTAAMVRAGIVGATRAGRLRLSFHVSTTESDVDLAIEALTGRVRA